MEVQAYDIEKRGQFDLHEYIGLQVFLHNSRKVFTAFDAQRTGIISLDFSKFVCKSLRAFQGCWEVFCGTGLGSASVSDTCIGAQIADLSPASAGLSSASTGRTRQHECLPTALVPLG